MVNSEATLLEYVEKSKNLVKENIDNKDDDKVKLKVREAMAVSWTI